MENLLKNEKSPYLKQHENNPVHWFAWNKKALDEAKRLGYAEQNSNDDLNGLDTLHKILILSTIAFNKKINLKDINYSGINYLTKADIFFADKLGFRIKLLGIGSIDKKKIRINVAPYLISKKRNFLMSIII